MKVKELIEKLREMDAESIVTMSSDAEGNGYQPLRNVFEGFYRPEGEWRGEFIDPEDGDELEEGDKKTVCFWP